MRRTGSITFLMESVQAAIRKGDIMTQNERILKYLRTHKRGITPQVAYDLFGCMRLSGRIWDLRSEGHKISTNLIEVPNRYGDIPRVAQYKLLEK